MTRLHFQLVHQICFRHHVLLAIPFSNTLTLGAEYFFLERLIQPTSFRQYTVIMPSRPNQAISSASRRAKRTIDSASPSTSSASLTPPLSSQSHAATTTRSGRSVKRPLPDYTDYSDDEEDNDAVEDVDEDQLEDEEESIETDSVPVANPLRIKLTVNSPGVRPKPRQSTSFTKKSASHKKKKAEEPPDMDGDMLNGDDVEDEEGVTFGEGEDDNARGSKSPTKMTARQRAKGNKDLQEGLLVLEEGVLLSRRRPCSDYGMLTVARAAAPSSRALVLTEQEKLERKEEASRRRRRQVEQKLQDEQVHFFLSLKGISSSCTIHW